VLPIEAAVVCGPPGPPRGERMVSKDIRFKYPFNGHRGPLGRARGDKSSLVGLPVVVCRISRTQAPL